MSREIIDITFNGDGYSLLVKNEFGFENTHFFKCEYEHNAKDSTAVFCLLSWIVDNEYSFTMNTKSNRYTVAMSSIFAQYKASVIRERPDTGFFYMLFIDELESLTKFTDSYFENTYFVRIGGREFAAEYLREYIDWQTVDFVRGCGCKRCLCEDARDLVKTGQLNGTKLHKYNQLQINVMKIDNNIFRDSVTLIKI